MPEPLTSTVTTRVTKADRAELDQLAHDRSAEPLALARTLLREGVRRERHPGITFRDVRGERRASVEGRRIDVWQVMETLWSSDGSVEDAASSLDLTPVQVRAALGYYAAYPEEIDEVVERNREMAVRLEEHWRREQASLRR